VEVLTFNPPSQRPALIEKRRQELLREGKDWRVTGRQVAITRELIPRSDRQDAEQFADMVRADAEEHGAHVNVRVIEIPDRRKPGPTQPALPLPRRMKVRI
jgi:hypothetical protein